MKRHRLLEEATRLVLSKRRYVLLRCADLGCALGKEEPARRRGAAPDGQLQRQRIDFS